MKPLVLSALILATILIAAMGCASEEPYPGEQFLAVGAEDSDQSLTALDPGPQGQQGPQGSTPGLAALEDAPLPHATPAPEMMMKADAQDSAGDGDAKAQPSLPAQDRVIVHTAFMSLVTEDVALTIGRIGDTASGLGGWVVNSDRSSRHSGSIDVRVPAETLDEALRRIGDLAEVEARSITSQDVTDEYVDSQSRLVSMRATEERLLTFLEQAENVEEALLVQRELSDLQIRIEETQGRLNFLSQTAAYSLIQVSLRLAPQAIAVDAGEDMSARVGQAVRFRASFVPPTDIDDYSFVWDFGDGTSASGRGTIPTQGGERLTATVTHFYEEDLDSEYIATITLTGTGERGIAEGTDSLEVSVRRIPSISVFAGEDLTVEEGARTEFSASFTRPAELWDYQYQWDFGDGSPSVTGSPEEGGTRFAVEHAFADYRPFPYTAVLTVTAMSDAGEVSGSDTIDVWVTEAERFLVGGWDVADTFKTAVRALSTLIRELVRLSIWLAVFSPVIAVGIAVLFLLRRFLNRLDPSIGRRREFREVAEPSPQEGTVEEPPARE